MQPLQLPKVNDRVRVASSHSAAAQANFGKCGTVISVLTSPRIQVRLDSNEIITFFAMDLELMDYGQPPQVEMRATSPLAMHGEKLKELIRQMCS